MQGSMDPRHPGKGPRAGSSPKLPSVLIYVGFP